MISLCGFGVSNYYNKIKLVMLEKEIVFQEKLVYPWQCDTFLKNSPLGKIPFIETDVGALSESQVIVDYLEERFTNRRLYPADNFSRAKCRELIQHIELNCKWVARRLYKECFFGHAISSETKQEVYDRLTHNLRCLVPFISFDPFIMGKDFTIADCVAFAHFYMINQATRITYGEALCDRFFPELSAYMAMLAVRPHFLKVMADRVHAMQAFTEVNVNYQG